MTAVTYITSASIDEVRDFYERELLSNGWTDVKVMDLPRYDGFGVIHNRFILQGQKDGRTAQVDILFDVEDHLNYTSVLIVISE